MESGELDGLKKDICEIRKNLDLPPLLDIIPPSSKEKDKEGVEKGTENTDNSVSENEAEKETKNDNKEDRENSKVGSHTEMKSDLDSDFNFDESQFSAELALHGFDLFFTPPILLLVDELQGLERDLIQKQSDCVGDNVKVKESLRAEVSVKMEEDGVKVQKSVQQGETARTGVKTVDFKNNSCTIKKRKSDAESSDLVSTVTTASQDGKRARTNVLSTDSSGSATMVLSGGEEDMGSGEVVSQSLTQIKSQDFSVEEYLQDINADREGGEEEDEDDREDSDYSDDFSLTSSREGSLSSAHGQMDTPNGLSEKEREVTEMLLLSQSVRTIYVYVQIDPSFEYHKMA